MPVVYVAVMGTQYDGSETIGVYSTVDKAKERCEAHALDDGYGDFWEVDGTWIDDTRAPEEALRHLVDPEDTPLISIIYYKDKGWESSLN
jgi:hypothetical protein